MNRISDEQRRATAAKLRAMDAERIDRVYGGQATNAFLVLGYIADAVGLCYTPYDFTAVELRDRLADLIDPGSERTCLTCGYCDVDEGVCYRDPNHTGRGLITVLDGSCSWWKESI